MNKHNEKIIKKIKIILDRNQGLYRLVLGCLLLLATVDFLETFRTDV